MILFEIYNNGNFSFLQNCRERLVMQSPWGSEFQVLYSYSVYFAALVVMSSHTQGLAMVRAMKLSPVHQPPSTWTPLVWTRRQSSHTPKLWSVRAGAFLTLRSMTSRAPSAYQITNQKKP